MPRSSSRRCSRPPRPSTSSPTAPARSPVEGACASLGASEDELVSWIALEGLTGLRHAWTVKDLNGIGVTLDGSGLTRLTAEQTEGLLADSSG